MREYDPLASYYDRYWGPRFHDAARPAVERLLYSRVHRGARLLDLCCGCGHLTQELAARAFRVVGIDSSIEMLRRARRRVPSARLVCADADRFALARGCCDAAASTFDSINHLTDLHRVAAAFAATAAALKAGGLFVFDINTEEAYRSEWGKSSSILDADLALSIAGCFDPVSRLGTTHITIRKTGTGVVSAVPDNAPERFSSTPENDSRPLLQIRVRQRCYEVAEIAPLLTAAGFDDIQAFAAAEVGMAGDIGVGRVFIRGRRSGGAEDR